MKQKATLRIPTNDTYAFIEVQVEGNADFICEKYHEFTNLMKSGAGIDPKAFDAFVERQLLGQPNHIEEYNQMSPEQQKFVQVNKRALKRIAYKNNAESKNE